jgi:hypothetical protein
LAEKRTRSVDQTDGCTYVPCMDEDTQIGSDGVVVGEVSGDGGEDGPAVNTTSRLLRSWRRRAGRDNLPRVGWCGVGASESAAIVDIGEPAGARCEVGVIVDIED